MSFTGHGWPYVNLHELNLDWCLSVAESAKEHLDGYDADMAQIAADTQTASDAATNAAASELACSGYATSAHDDAVAAAGDASNAHTDALAAAGSASDAHNDALAAAGSASDAHNDALAAAASETNADSSAEAAEAWAVGTIDGTPVTSDAAQYENNAKYYADSASSDAASAAASVLSIDTIKASSYCNLYRIGLSGDPVCTVLASRTLTDYAGTVTTVNIPGLVAFRLPFSNSGDYSSHFDAEVDGNTVRVSSEPFLPDPKEFIIGFAASSENLDYILKPYPPLTSIVNEEVTGKKYRVIFARAYNIATGQFVSDNIGIFSADLFFAASAIKNDYAIAINGATIGVAD